MKLQSLFSYSFAVYIAKFSGLLAILLMSNKMTPNSLSQYAMFTLVVEFSVYFILGAQYNLINNLSVLKVERKKTNLIGDTFLFSIITITFFSTLFIFFKDHIFLLKKYDLNNYLFLIFFSLIIVIFNILFVKIARIRKLIKLLILEQVTYPVGILVFVFFIKSVTFKDFIVIYCTLKLIPLIFFSLKINVFGNYFFNGFIYRLKHIFISSIKLLLYNAFFAIILITAQSIISANIETDTFGVFKIGFLIASIPNLLILGFEALLYPNIYKKIQQNKLDVINQFESIYYLLICFLFSFVMIFLDLFSLIFVELNSIYTTILILLLIQFSILKVYLRKILLVTEKKELMLFCISLIPLSIICIFSQFISFNLNLFLTILLLSFIIYDLFLLHKSNYTNSFSTISYCFLVISLLIMIHFSFSNEIIGALFISLSLLINYKNLHKIKSIIESISV